MSDYIRGHSAPTNTLGNVVAYRYHKRWSDMQSTRRPIVAPQNPYPSYHYRTLVLDNVGSLHADVGARLRYWVRHLIIGGLYLGRPLPMSIDQIVNLRHIVISDGFGGELALPGVFASVSRLYILSLRRVPVVFADCSKWFLSELRLEECGLRTLPEGLRKMTLLRKLVLAGPMESIAGIGWLVNLAELHLIDCLPLPPDDWQVQSRWNFRNTDDASAMQLAWGADDAPGMLPYELVHLRGLNQLRINRRTLEPYRLYTLLPSLYHVFVNPVALKTLLRHRRNMRALARALHASLGRPESSIRLPRELIANIISFV